MTREEAITTLAKIQKLLAIYPKRKKQKESVNEINTAIGMAIEALKGRTDGEWREMEDDYGGVYWECSNCEDAFFLEVGTPKENNYNFCPSCGAWMERREP